VIKRAEGLKKETVNNLRGGNGYVEITKFLEKEEFHDKGRMFSKITIKPGNSIGLHQHVGDCETFYVSKGEGKVYDNGIEEVIKTGDVLYTDNNESHSVENTGTTDLELIALILYV